MQTLPTGRLLTALAIFASMLATPARAQLSVEWLTQYGSSGNAAGGNAITVDALGQSWVCGITTGSLGGPNAGAFDVFLSRLSASGGVDFTQQRGGTGEDYAQGVALVGSDTVFVGGSTNSNSIDGQVPLDFSDAMVIRYDTAGTWQGTTLSGSTGADYATAVAGSGTHLLITGFAGNGHAFLTKRDSTGSLVWTRNAVMSNTDVGRGAAFDSVGNAYMAGDTYMGENNLFVTRYDPAGNQTLLKQLGTNRDDSAQAVKVDGSGNIYLTGYTKGALGGQSNAGDDDAYVMKLDSNGNVLWTRLLGGSGEDRSHALGLDGAGHVWIGGYSYSDFGDHTNAGGDDAFVAEYDASGSLLGTIFLSTPVGDEVNGLAVGPDGAIYVTGETWGELGGSNPGNGQVFVAKITAAPEPSAALLLAGAGAGLLLRRRRA